MCPCKSQKDRTFESLNQDGMQPGQVLNILNICAIVCTQGATQWVPAQLSSLSVGSVVRLATAKGVHAAEARVAALPGCKTWPSPVQACTISPGTIGVDHINLFKGKAAEEAGKEIMQARDRPALNWFKSYSLHMMMTHHVKGEVVGQAGMLIETSNVLVEQQVRICTRVSWQGFLQVEQQMSICTHML